MDKVGEIKREKYPAKYAGEFWGWWCLTSSHGTNMSVTASYTEACQHLRRFFKNQPIDDVSMLPASQKTKPQTQKGGVQFTMYFQYLESKLGDNVQSKRLQLPSFTLPCTRRRSKVGQPRASLGTPTCIDDKKESSRVASTCKYSMHIEYKNYPSAKYVWQNSE